MVKSNDEPWFDDGFGKDLRVLFYEMLQKNQTMLESLKSGKMEPIKVTLLKVFLGEDLRMGDIQDEKVGPWLCFSVKYINVNNVWQGLTDFTISYLSLNLAIFHGLPFKSKREDAPAEGLALAIFGGGCTHPALPCNSASIELQHFNEEDTRLSQLDCTCSHQACILNIIDSRSRSLEAALFEGYIFAFKPLAKAQAELADSMAPARLYSHVLRVIKGKIYLFCLRQVEQLLPKAPGPREASNSFAEYFRLNIIKPSIIKGGKDELTGFSLLNPLNSHTTLGNVISTSTGMASHHSKIPALPSVAAETCWLSQILSKSMGDGLYQEKVLGSARIQSIKKLFMAESEASISMFNKHMDELCPLSQERLAYNSDSLSIIHQQMLLAGLSELIKLWPQVYPNANLKQFLRDVQLSIKNRLNSLPFEIRNICTPLVRPVPPPPPAGLNLPFLHGPHRPPGLNHSFPKHMMPPPFPAPGFRPLSVNHWSNSAPREPAQPSSQGYLKPDPYAGESRQCQAEWQTKLGDPSNLLYQYWMARKEDNITLQPISKRQNNDFDSRVLPKD
ncbi:hypothetical protein DSO57_1024427 [Entomophthora muscae]|uniref:Uncharacterized protein n=1 Tax=Entomophthora muscae TaxID=34485 RepID=A0ACC2TE26_9FUNG|nr:hypothetical protein DSO57_1024427 [Entomophthora muscae]